MSTIPSSTHRPFHHAVILLSGCAAAAGLAPASSAQSIEALPTPLRDVSGVSGDGRVIVGSSSDGTPSMWSADRGVEPIPLLPNTTSGRNIRVSEDGTTVVGVMRGVGTVQAYRWRRSTGTLPLPMQGGITNASMFDCSGDGSFVVGGISVPNGPLQPVVWDGQNVLRSMTLPLGALAGGVTSTSRDGQQFAGQVFYSSDPPGFRAIRWAFDGSVVALAPNRSDAAAMSADGTCVVGRVNSTGMRWTDAGAFLLPIPESAVDVNWDGSVVVTSTVVWTLARGASGLSTELSSRGVVLGEWSGLQVTGMSSDGRVLVGVGRRGATFGGWRATLRCPLSVPYCRADSTCDGFLDFFDYDAFVEAFENGSVSADFNGDGFLDFFDYDEFVSAFETGC